MLWPSFPLPLLRIQRLHAPLRSLSTLPSQPESSRQNHIANLRNKPRPRLSNEQREQPTFQVVPLQYFVSRTKSNNLPVYQSKSGTTKLVTSVRKITGDIASLRQDLRSSLGIKDENVTINQLTKAVLIKGFVKDDVIKFLEERKF